MFLGSSRIFRVNTHDVPGGNSGLQLVGGRYTDMVLEVLSDTWKVNVGLDTILAEELLVADTAELEKLWSLNRAYKRPPNLIRIVAPRAATITDLLTK